MRSNDAFLQQLNSKSEYWYSIIDTRFADRDYNDAAVNIRHVLELILRIYTEKYCPDAADLDPFRKINALEDASVIDASSVNALHGLRKLANKGAHASDQEEVSRGEIERSVPVLKREVRKLAETLILNDQTPSGEETVLALNPAPKASGDRNATVYCEPAPPQEAFLLLIEKSKRVRTIRLSGTMSFGRKNDDRKNDIEVTSSITSRNHGEFIYEEASATYYYKDNGGMNGSFLNGNKLEVFNDRGSKAVKLEDGDVIRIDREDLDKPHPDAVFMMFSTTLGKERIWSSCSLLGRTELSIGRDPSNNIVLSDFMAAKKHAVISLDDMSPWIRDKSGVGTAVNKQQISSKTILHPMDVIGIANSVLIFVGDTIFYTSAEGSMGAAPGVSSDRPADSPRTLPPQSAKNTVMRVNMNSVTVKQHSSFRKKALLKDINLDIEAGDFVLILGGAGAGKTSFIKALLGEYRANGLIQLEGMNLYDNYKMLKHKIGIVPQFSTTRDSDTVYHTIMDAAVSKLSGEYSKAEIESRVTDIIDKLMLTQLTDSLIKNLSGGQKKRVEVALQAVSDQKIFILDEPDSGMDYASRTDLMRNLKDCTATGSVVAVISHSPDDVAELFTKVIVLAKSKEDQVGHLAYYGDVPHAYEFFGVNKLSEIVLEINYEGGHGRATEFINKFEQTRRGTL